MKRLTELVNLRSVSETRRKQLTATEPGTTAPGNTNQDTQVKPNTDQTATGTQLVLIIKIRNKAILNKITKMLNHQHLNN